MSETLSFTYSYLIDKTVDVFKQKYKNIDSLQGDIESANKNIFSTNKWCSRSGGYNTDSVQIFPSVTTNKKFSAVSSSTLKSNIETQVKSVCNCALTDNVTPKGLLAYMNFITWFLEKGTSVILRSTGNTTGVPCLSIPTLSSYNGVKKSDKKDYILKSDFDSFLNTIQAITVSAVLSDYVADSGYAVSGNCSSCSCSSSSCSSSSCSSSSCSSSSSSSCSSSSCSSSSSSSSAFIVYMKLN